LLQQVVSRHEAQYRQSRRRSSNPDAADQAANVRK
jgi:hypothetical protein